MPQIEYTEAIATVLTQPVLSPAATSITVADVTDMPDITGGSWFYLTLANNDSGEYEVIRVTNITGFVLTVVRAQAGTIASTFSVAATAVEARVVGPLWEDLRSWASDTFCTPAAITLATQDFLDEPEIQSLIDASLVPYITIVDANALIAPFLTETEIDVLISNALLGYTTVSDVNTIVDNSIDAEVINRDLQNATQVDQLITDALTASGFINGVTVANGGEPFGYLAGTGTLADPLTIFWDGRNPGLLDSVPLNNAHRTDVSDPHNVTAAQVNCLTIGTPDIGVGYTPTDDDHPATKKYVDDQVSVSSNATIDTSHWTEVFDPSNALAKPYYGWVDLGQDINTPAENYRRCWVIDAQAKKSGVGGQNSYTFNIPASVQLDHAPSDIQAIIDSNAISSPLSADMSLYITNVSQTQVTFVMDVAKDGSGLGSADLTIRYTFSGVKTI